MTTITEIETRLTRALAVMPSEQSVHALDQRVARAMAAPAATHRPWARSRRSFLRPLALVAAFVFLTGTAIGAVNLLERTVGSDPTWRTAWDRAEVLGLVQTDAGLTLTLERAYADVNQVMIFMTVEGLGLPSTSDGGRAAIDWTGELRDPSGRQLTATTIGGEGAVEPDISAVLQTWVGAPDPMAGTWELIVTSAGYAGGGMVPGICTVGATEPECVNPPADAMVHGTWRFQFDLPKPVGAIASTAVSGTVDGATITVTELRVSPTMISARLALLVNGTSVAYWGTSHDFMSEMSIRHGGTTFVPNSSYHVTQDPADRGPNGDENEFYVEVGSDDATGTWHIEIPAIDYHETGENDPAKGIRVSGPWTLTVTVP